VDDQRAQEILPTQHPVLQKRRIGVSRALVIVGGLALIAAAAGYLWLNYDRFIEAASARAEAAPEAANVEEMVTLKEFQSFQQLTAESLRSTNQDIAAQQADLRKLSDQVSALTARIDVLQSAAEPAPAQPATLAEPVIPPRPAAIAPRKKPRIPKPAGPISVGGAPLPGEATKQPAGSRAS
jgi:uncharacterized coiled-coil protein SlyX